jgi:predicted phosphatase
MQLLILLTLAGVVSGTASGALISGNTDTMIIGAATGLILGVVSWLVTATALRILREYRLNQHFSQDQSERE